MTVPAMQALRWPDGQKRTRINQRETRKQWKKTLHQYLAELHGELGKIKAVGIVVTGEQESERIDPGVAVYFTLPPKEAGGDWQDVLGIDNPRPTPGEIQDRFKELARRYHPDNQHTGNYDLYRKIEEAKREALSWATGDFGKKHARVIASDRFDQVRLNIKSIQVTIAALRRVEEVGAPGFLERAFEGFAVPQIEERNHVQSAAH